MPASSTTTAAASRPSSPAAVRTGRAAGQDRTTRGPRRSWSASALSGRDRPVVHPLHVQLGEASSERMRLYKNGVPSHLDLMRAMVEEVSGVLVGGLGPALQAVARPPHGDDGHVRPARQLGPQPADVDGHRRGRPASRPPAGRARPPPPADCSAPAAGQPRWPSGCRASRSWPRRARPPGASSRAAAPSGPRRPAGPRPPCRSSPILPASGPRSRPSLQPPSRASRLPAVAMRARRPPF
jgi:hypothetical protein